MSSRAAILINGRVQPSRQLRPGTTQHRLQAPQRATPSFSDRFYRFLLGVSQQYLPVVVTVYRDPRCIKHCPLDMLRFPLCLTHDPDIFKLVKRTQEPRFGLHLPLCRIEFLWFHDHRRRLLRFLRATRGRSPSLRCVFVVVLDIFIVSCRFRVDFTLQANGEGLEPVVNVDELATVEISLEERTRI